MSHHHHHHSRNFCDPHSDHHPFPIVPKKTTLSSTILDYYQNYGQNRDLEKYLRFRKYGRCSSTDESSVPDDENVNRLGKSLENLSILHSNIKQPEEKLQKSKSNESIIAEKQIQKVASKESLKNLFKSDTDVKSEKKSAEEYKINIKQAQKTKSKRSQKIESNIEISFSAPQTIFPEVYQLPQTQRTAIPQGKAFLETSTETTQTDSIVQYPDTPLRPIGKQTKFDTDIARPASAASSVASVSNKQRLEWDSMADVGYEKSLHRSKSFESNLTTFERNALKKFFAERGLKFEDDNIVVFASKNTPKTSSTKDASTSARSMSVDSVFDVVAEKPQKLSKSKWEQAFRKILEEKHAKLSAETAAGKPQFGKELWKSALKKFREKYGRHLDEQSSSDLCITYPEIHSTPIVEVKPDTSKGAIPKVKRKPDVEKEKETTVSSVKEQKQEIPSKIRNPSISQILEQIERMERSCQTSMISLYSKECQVEKDLSGNIVSLTFFLSRL